MQQSNNVFNNPWYVLLASGNGTILVLCAIILSSFSFAVGFAVKNVTASLACVIYETNDCKPVGETLIDLVMVLLITLAIARGIIYAACSLFNDCEAIV